MAEYIKQNKHTNKSKLVTQAKQEHIQGHFFSLKYLIRYFDLIKNCVHVSKLLTGRDHN